MNAHPQILVVDDDAALLRLVAHWLEREGQDVTTASTGQEGLDALSEGVPDVVLLDLQLPDRDGVDLLEEIRERHCRVPVIMVTADEEVEQVVRAMRAGAFDYLTKPLRRTKLVTTVRNALEKVHDSQEIAALRQEARGDRFPGIVGQSVAMRDLFRQMDRVAGRDVTVLVRGESGTGKELVARALHDASPRARGPFVALNCAAIPESLQESQLFGHEKGAFTGADERRRGSFEQAQGGTLFLDEVGELPLLLQAKLLRALQERSFARVGGDKEIAVDVRIVAATHRDPASMVSIGTFRLDLYWRLAVFELLVPPLRDRENDILMLAERFAQEFSRVHATSVPRFSPEVEQCLASHRWPGNVRELRNAIERAVLLASDGTIRERDLPPTLAQPLMAPSGAESDHISFDDGPPPELRTPPRAENQPQGRTLAEMEREAIVKALEETGGNVSEVVRVLGMPRTTLYRRLKAYGLR